MTRYPGDQDPTNLKLAISRKFIAGAIRQLRNIDREAINRLIQSPLVDRVILQTDNEDGAEFTSVVLQSGPIELSWIAYVRPYGEGMYNPTRVYWFRVSNAGRPVIFTIAKEAEAAFYSAIAREPRKNPRAADPSMLSPRGRPIGKFLGYFRPKDDENKVVGGIRFEGKSMANVFVSPAEFNRLYYYSKFLNQWILVDRGMRFWISSIVEIRLTNDPYPPRNIPERYEVTDTVTGPIRLLIKERKRVAVYEVRP